MQRARETRLVLYPRQKQVINHGDPYLRQDGVFRRAEEGFYLQVLPDPPEKQLDGPSFSVDPGDIGGRKLKMAGQEFIGDIALTVVEGDETQVIGIVGPGLFEDKRRPLVFQRPFPGIFLCCPR